MKRLLLASAVGALLAWGWFLLMLSPVNPGSQTSIAVTIARGDSVSVIAQTLEDLGLIRSTVVFKLYARLQGKQGNLQAGNFTLSQSQSVGEILDALQRGKPGEISITIPEGWTIADIDSFMASKGLGKPGDILDCAFACDFSDMTFLPAENFAQRADRYGSRVEGYVFPETYFVSTDAYQPEVVLRRMLETFRKRVVDGHAAELRQSGRTLHQAVIMASLIEKETRKHEERAIVSGILWKRQEAGTLLGVDATVRYVVGKPTAPITMTDLAVDSPYNTRKFVGLPPGPISTAGESSLVAAMQPQSSEYWYYLHGNDGVIRYARTNDEHNVNKARYLR